MKLVALAIVFGAASFVAAIWALIALDTPLAMRQFPTILFLAYTAIGTVAVGLFFSNLIDNWFTNRKIGHMLFSLGRRRDQ